MSKKRKICFWCGKLFYTDLKSEKNFCCRKCQTKYKKEKQGAERRGD
ncbi:sigma70/sigmaF-like domain protein [Clostridioides difficile CD160]|nr:sigma70/sigmaF-like domain protein [Clostridioides difficile CD160]